MDTHGVRAVLRDDETWQTSSRTELEHIFTAIERRCAFEVSRQCARRVPSAPAVREWLRFVGMWRTGSGPRVGGYRRAARLSCSMEGW